MAFLDNLDIANKSCQLMGCARILDPSEDTVQNNELSFVYDKDRRAELRRNVWRFSIRRAVLRPMTTTMQRIIPFPWQSNVTYLPGAIVSDANGMNWISLVAENLNQPPGTNNVWDQYFGPMTADIWDSSGSTAYYAGDMVYVPQGNPGSYVIYQSLVNANNETPQTADAWVSTTQYGLNAVVSFAGAQWRSLIAVNMGITPAQPPANWNPAVIYSNGQQVVALDGYIYTGVGGGNVGHEPTQDGGVHWTNTTVPAAWSNSPTLFPSATTWNPIYASLSNISLIYPITSGPTAQSFTRNVFVLPSGFLREAPQDPKAGSTSFLGAPSGLRYTDWEFEDGFIVSRQPNLIVFRFVADITVVNKMDDMFCNGLAARMAMDTCERITQSNVKMTQITQEYKTTMSEARIVNGIETGPTEPAEDDFITCRL